MFEKTLSDLVRGIRAHRGTESQYISQCMTEIKKELKQENLAVKANAISKLTYLQMLGYDISWAAFNIIEVMSSPKFTYKRIGYLAATQCFHEGLDVVMLTTNMIRKDMSSGNQFESGLALSGLSCFMTPDLARDLANDVLTVTSSGKPYLRKKAIVVLYKVFLKFPDALRPAFPRLKSCLEDPDPGVQCAAVSVICELAQKNPRNYLSLAPVLFKLMNSSSNNWMLIKIIKLFGALCPIEPRLGKKLSDPLTSLIHSTSAMSLLYECICTVITGLASNTAVVQLCVSKLRLFMEDADQNLKYLGLLAMSLIMQQQPKTVLQVKDIILDCIEDRDESIRVRALDLLAGMANKKNIMEIVKKLMSHIDTTESTFFRDSVIEKIITMCSHNSYQHITNFEWYITVLVEMTRFEGTRHGKLVASQMLDVTIRVKDVRPFSVRQMATIVENSQLFLSSGKDGVCEVLYAAAWIVGEFSEHLTDAHPLLEALLHPQVTNLPGHIQAVFVQNIVKLYSSILVKAEADGTPETTEEVGAMLVEKLPVFMQSGDLEVQERACCILQLMKYIVKLQSKGAAVASELTALFAGDLNPVAVKAQRKVPVPEGLDLDKWINDPPSESEDEDDKFGDGFFSKMGKGDDVDRHYKLNLDDDDASPSVKRKKKGKEKGKKRKKSAKEEAEEEEIEKARERRLEQQKNNPHYLKPSTSAVRKPVEEDLETGKPPSKDIPVSKLELGIPLLIETPRVMEPVKTHSKKGKKGKKKKRRGHRDDEEEEESFARPTVDTSYGEMPEGARSTDEDETPGSKDKTTGKDVFRQLDVDLDAPLRDDEVLPVRSHRVVVQPPKEDEEEETKAQKKGKKAKTKEKDKKKKKRSKKHAEAEEEEPEVEDRMEVSEQMDEPQVEEGERKKKKKKRESKGKREKDASPALVDLGSSLAFGEDVVVRSPATAAPSKPISKEKSPAADDLEFWLSTETPSAPQKAEPPVAVVVTEPPPTETKPKPSSSSSKKSRKSKGEKEKKGKKRKKSSSPAAADTLIGGLDEGDTELVATGGSSLLELGMGGGELGQQQLAQQQQAATAASSFKLLAEDTNLVMTYDLRADPMYNNLVTVAIVFKNKTEHQLIQLDFNVLDSLNTKLQRPMGSPAQGGIPVPFSLLPESANECQFRFYVQEFHMPQKLRGTLTYMIKSADGTAQDKMDFSLRLSSSGFICPTVIAQDRFAALLSGGGLSETQTLKLSLGDFPATLTAVSTTLHLMVIELLGESASLYGCSIAGHHICALLKRAGENQATVSIKGSDGRLVASLVDELRALA